MAEDQSSNDSETYEYDFSQGVRGKYVQRLGGPNAPWVGEMATRDTQRWIAEALLQFQRLESSLVIYFAILHNQKPREAGRAASLVVEDPKSAPSEQFLKDLKDATETRQEDRNWFVHLMHERNWLVHRSFVHLDRDPKELPEFTERVSNAAKAASNAHSTIRLFIVARCESIGISATEVEKTSARVIKEWAAA